jgi:uncharacterized protein (TIGR03435 family)
MMKARALVAVGIVALAGSVAGIRAAQAPDTPKFEVASVKPNKSGDGATALGFQPGRFRAINETLVRLIGEAYATSFPLPRHQIIGGPTWIDADRFDVDAVVGGNPLSEQQHLMLRALLADRFKLATHNETRELPIYNLVKVRSDGRLGEKLRRSDIDCAALRAAGSIPPPVRSGPPPCIMGFGRGTLSAKAMTISQLANLGLTRLVNRPVVDRTGLDGAYDWTLEWMPNQPSPSQLDSPGTSAQIDPDRPSIFTALQEQLGLKLESTKGPVDVLVIDHVEPPNED